MPCRVEIVLKDGRILPQETKDYEGFFTRPVSWAAALEKFNKLAARATTEGQRTAIADTVGNLEQVSVRELMTQLGSVAQHCGGASCPLTRALRI